MSFKENLNKRYTDVFLKKYGDRLNQIQGNVISIKIEEKSILWIFNKINVTILLRPDRSKNVVKCVYNKKRFFKNPPFIPISQGNLLIVQGLKGKSGKANREQIEIMNIRNLTNKKDLIPIEGQSGQNIKRVQKIQRYK
ncbi:MAG: hypothetical protein Q8900_01740 [Bacillota bacterium]|nr:hypothetical protein [Bacillota bacterium]